LDKDSRIVASAVGYSAEVLWNMPKVIQIITAITLAILVVGT
jgi:hypothetical protein